MKADELELWLKRENYTLAEAALLIIGESPDRFIISKLLANECPEGFRAVFGSMVDDAREEIGVVESELDEYQGQFYMEYALATHDPDGLLTRTHEQWLLTKVSKAAMRKWVKSRGYAFGFDDESVKKPDSDRKIDNLLRTITAIAMEEYGYKTDSSKSTAPKDIADALSTHGVTVGEKTILSWLREGAQLIDSSK